MGELRSWEREINHAMPCDIVRAEDTESHGKGKVHAPQSFDMVKKWSRMRGKEIISVQLELISGLKLSLHNYPFEINLKILHFSALNRPQLQLHDRCLLSVICRVKSY